MFDEFRAPAPPNPGVREFAIVATRARALRRRRRTWTASGAAAVTGLLAIITLVVDRPTKLAITTDEVPTTQLGATVIEYSLDDLASIDQLPLLDLGGRSFEFMSGDQRGEVFPRSDGAVCVRNIGSTDPPSCAPVGAGLHVAFWNDLAAPDQPPVAIFLISTGVSVAIKSAGAECLAVLNREPVEVWTCTRLDKATTSVRVIDTSQILIDTLAS